MPKLPKIFTKKVIISLFVAKLVVSMCVLCACGAAQQASNTSNASNQSNSNSSASSQVSNSNASQQNQNASGIVNQAQNATKPESTSSSSSSKDKSAESKLHHVVAYTSDMDGNALWCAPLQLCWNNAMKVGGGEFLGDAEDIKRLNEQSVIASDIGEDHYYTYTGKVDDPKAVYKEITSALEERFGESSKIITEDFLNENEGMMLLYAMLFREFQYAVPFDIVADGDGSFGGYGEDNYSNAASYFGIGSGHKDDSSFYNSISDQVEVLYHDDDDNCAVMLHTKQGDDVILVKAPQGKTAKDIFDNAMKKAASYDGSRKLAVGERLEVPDIDLDADDTFDNLRGALSANGDFEVDSARQVTELKLDNTGGRVKSEAVMTMKATAIMDGDKPVLRNFVFDDTYATFLVDGNVSKAGGDYTSAVPYLALLVNDISEVQSR